VKGNEMQSNVKSDNRTFEKVFDRQRRRVRGLWLREGTYYAQMRVNGRAKRIALQAADSIATALTARQELKNKIAKGEYPPKKVAPDQILPADHSLGAAIKGYQTTRDTLKQVDEATANREDSSLTLWERFAGTKHVSEVDSALLLAHAQSRTDTATELRRERLKEELEELEEAEGLSEEERKERMEWRQKKLAEGAKARAMSGRSQNLDVQTLGKVLDWAPTQKWLKTKPDLTWTKLAKPPKKVRLLTEEQLDEFANANVTKGDVEAQDALTFNDTKPHRYELTARASQIDPRTRYHSEIDFVFEKDGKPPDAGERLGGHAGSAAG
jgi:hypothetical protein